MSKKVGLCYLDPHRPNAERLVGLLGKVKDRVVYLDFDADIPVAYNQFSGARPEDFGRFTGDTVQTIGPLFGTEGFRRLEHFLRNGIYGLFTLGLNLAKLPVLFEQSGEGQLLRAQIIKGAPHEAVV